MTRFAQKTWRKVAVNTQPDLSDSSLRSAWLGPLQSGEISDVVMGSSNNLQRAGSYVGYGYDSLLGNILEKPNKVSSPSAWIDGGLQTFGPNLTISVWFKVTDATVLGANWFLNLYRDSSNGWGIIQVATSQAIGIYDDLLNANAIRYPTVVPLKWVHLVATIEDTTDQKLYIDGHLVGSGVSPGESLSANTKSLSAFFRVYSLTGAVTGYGFMTTPALYNDVKDQAWVTSEYQKGAKAIQFATDWGHDADGITRGVPEYLGNGPFSVYFRTFKVTTDTVNGHLCKVIECVTPGNFFMPWSLPGVRGAETGYGSWSCWVYVPAGDAGDFVKWDLFNSVRNPGVVGGSGYLMGADGAGTATIQERGVGNVVAGTNPVGQWVHLHGTRRYDGLFELFVNGVSQGTGTDTTVASGPYTSFDMTEGTKVAVASRNGGYAITKYLGVVPPRM